MLRPHRPQESPADPEVALQEAVEARRTRRLAEKGEPEFPSTGTEMIARRLAEARLRRDRTPSSLIDLRDRTP